MKNSWKKLITEVPERELERKTLWLLLFFCCLEDLESIMNTLALKKESKTFGLKQILLTLKKGPGHYPTTAVIAPIGKNLDVKITDRKLIRIPSKDGHDIFLKEMRNSERFDTDNGLRPKLTQVLTSKRKSLLDTKRCSIFNNLLTSESEFCDKFTNILDDCKRTDNLNDKAPLESSSLNKQDRFVPNILRSTKMVENTPNNNSLIGINPTQAASSPETEKRCKDDKNVKRKRKQVLNPLNIKRDLTHRAQLSKKNELNKSLLRISNRNIIEKSKTKIFGIPPTNSERKDSKECPEKTPECSATVEELTMDSCDPEKIYSANLDIPCQSEDLPSTIEAHINCNYDKSIKKIFDEFEVADYQNYIDGDNLGFNVDEMDKLLSSDIEGSLTDSSIVDHSNETVEYDVNGNDIDNHGNAAKVSTDEEKLEGNNIQFKIEPCYSDGADTKIETSSRLGCDINLDYICSDAWDGVRSYNMSEMNLWSNEFKDYYSTDDFQDFHPSLERDSSSTDTASELETCKLNSTQSSGFILPENKNLEQFSTSLVVSDVVPDNVFSDDSNNSCSDGVKSDDDTVEISLASSPMIQPYHLNSNDINDNNYCPSSSGIALGKLISNSQFHDDFNANLEIFEDGKFLLDDMLNMNWAVSKEDETCESILANSNAKFDDKHLSSIHEDLSDFDIENADDIKISRLIRLGNSRKNHFKSVSDTTLQPYAICTPKNELSVDTENQSNTNNIFMSNHDNSEFGTMKFENLPQIPAESTLNESTSLEDIDFSFGDELETGLQESNAGDEEFGHFDSTSANTSERNDLLLLQDVKAATSSRCSPLLPIERRNMTDLNTSKLKILLTRTQTCADYSSTNYRSALFQNGETDSGMANTEQCSQVVGYSDDDILNSTTSSYKSCQGQVTGHQIIGDISSFYAIEGRNSTTEGTAIKIDDSDDYSVAKRRNHHPLESELAYNGESYDCQLISYSVSSKTPASSGKLLTNLKKPKGGVWKDLVKRSKFLTQNISYIPCDFCENKYRSGAALANHIRLTHRYRPSRFRYRDKKYSCDKCSKEYMFPSAIQKHFKLHDNYTLTCRICEKHFSERIFLRRHMHLFHSDWALQCCYCKRKFSRKDALTRHITKCHGSEDFR